MILKVAEGSGEGASRRDAVGNSSGQGARLLWFNLWACQFF
jgi:hypothetical protein